MMTEMGWEVDEEVNQDKIGEADGMNLEVEIKLKTESEAEVKLVVVIV